MPVPQPGGLLALGRQVVFMARFAGGTGHWQGRPAGMGLTPPDPGRFLSRGKGVSRNPPPCV